MLNNVVDKWFLSLVEKLDGWGMLLFCTLTLLISGVLSALIGLERYRKGENAGMRTHALLSVGASFLMTISIWAIRLTGAVDYDVSRIAAGAVTGIGFLGAGVIIKDKFTVKGLSTATTLWICAAIGLATGAGFVLEAIIATFVTLFIVFVRNRIIIRVDQNAPHVIVKVNKDFPALQKLKEVCDNNSLNMKNIDIVHIGTKQMTVEVYFPYHTNPLLLDYYMNELKKLDDVLDAKKVMKNPKRKVENTHES